jgi:O-antigen/teichoic acid export membrane protein
MILSRSIAVSKRMLVNRWVRSIPLTLSASAFNRAFFFISNVLLANHLEKERYGLFSVYYTVFSVGIQFPNILDQLFIKVVGNESLSDSKDRVLKTFSMLKVAFAVSLAGLAIVALFFSIDGLSLLALGLYFIFSTNLAVHQSLSNFKEYSKVLILNSIFSLTLFLLIGSLRGFNEVNFWVSVSLMYVLSSVSLFRKINPFSGLKDDVKFMLPFVKSISKIGGALVIANILYLLFQRIDFFILNGFASLNDLADYSVALRLNSMLALLGTPITIMLYPQGVRKSTWESDLRGYVKRGAGLLVLTIIGAGILLLNADRIILLFYKATFIKASSYFVVLSIGTILLIAQQPFYYFFYAYELKLHLVILAGSQLLVGAVTTLLFIHQFGVLGAAIGNLSIYLFGSVYIGLVVWNRRKKS